jgi:predicted TPR repeat methyltransferase
LAARPGTFDIAVAADVFVYIGDLAEVFRTAAAALRPAGLFTFSVEACPDDAGDFRLGATRRYAHSLPYLRRLADAHGFTVERAQQSIIRKESDQGVDGLLMVLRRR